MRCTWRQETANELLSGVDSEGPIWGFQCCKCLVSGPVLTSICFLHYLRPKKEQTTGANYDVSVCQDLIECHRDGMKFTPEQSWVCKALRGVVYSLRHASRRKWVAVRTYMHAYNIGIDMLMHWQSGEADSDGGTAVARKSTQTIAGLPRRQIMKREWLCRRGVAPRV